MKLSVPCQAAENAPYERQLQLVTPSGHLLKNRPRLAPILPPLGEKLGL